MTEFMLEVGKTYVDNKPSGRSSIERIVGKVKEDTVEFERGFRYFSHRGAVYKENGHRFSALKDRRHPWKGRDDTFDLIREATRDDVKKDVLVTHLRYSEEDLENSSKFIPNDNPDFIMRLGNIYVNEFGIPILINFSRILESGNLRFEGVSERFGLTIYNTKGESRLKGKSMRDIAYMRVG